MLQWFVYSRINKEKQTNKANMKTNNLLIGIIILVLAALLLADGIISYTDPSAQLFSLGDVKGIVGFVLLVLAASYFRAAKD